MTGGRPQGRTRDRCRLRVPGKSLNDPSMVSLGNGRLRPDTLQR